MPFKRVGKNKYRHKGKMYTAKQVRAYYVTHGFMRKPRKRKRRK